MSSDNREEKFQNAQRHERVDTISVRFQYADVFANIFATTSLDPSTFVSLLHLLKAEDL